MNTTVKALQALYVKLGGALTDTYPDIASGAQVGNYTTIPDMIEACTEKAGSGGGGGDAGLPAVTTDDNEMVLRVVDGTWNKSNEQADAGTIAFNVSSGGDYETNVSIENINMMNNSIPIVCASFPMEHGTVKMPLVYSDDTTAVFSCVSYGASGATKNVLLGQDKGTSDSWQFFTE